ncbi:MAG: TPM domain-containing protein [Clostridia bacterium]|nr:TPM domain-containing protein [Clostridia bacterium]
MKSFLNILIALVLSMNMLTINASAHAKPREISVNDYAGILTDSSKSYIKSKNDILFSHTQAKIIFVTTESTEGQSISDYCSKLYSDWGMSRFGRRNSFFVVVDASKKEYSFLRGKNLRYAISESEAYKYMTDYFEPYFAQESYDKAAISLYNALAKWYETHYNDLTLGLDENIDRYTYGEKTKDAEVVESKLGLWIGAFACVVIIIVALSIKRHMDLKMRQNERRRLRKKFQIDIDKIINS